MRNNFAQQQNKRTKRSTVQTDFDPRQTLPSSAPLKKQSTTTNSGIYRNGLANTARNGSQTGTNFDPRQALPSTAAQKQQSVSLPLHAGSLFLCPGGLLPKKYQRRIL